MQTGKKYWEDFFGPKSSQYFFPICIPISRGGPLQPLQPLQQSGLAIWA